MRQYRLHSSGYAHFLRVGQCSEGLLVRLRNCHVAVVGGSARCWLHLRTAPANVVCLAGSNWALGQDGLGAPTVT